VPAVTATVDYLVVGAGAAGLAFVDSVFHETDATFAIVDRRHAPGGHWNDAYPFVALHQPASSYGLASVPFGDGHLDTEGYNAGLESLASGVEVANHFHSFMREVLVPSGRVAFHPMSEYTAEGDIRSLLSGERQRIVATTVVDATLMEAEIPSAHRRSFALSPEVVCVPPNDLPRLAPGFDQVTVLGGGKTGFDAVLWLLAHGKPPERITWVVPRDPWIGNRASVQGGLESFRRSTGPLTALMFEAIGEASSINDLCLRLEEARVWLRLDPEVWPTMQHCASVTEAEVVAARRIEDVVRLGRVTKIEPGQITLDRGTRPTQENTLFVDCTAFALHKSVGHAAQIFQPGRINLQMIRICQPTFSAALIGHIEASVPDEAEKQALAAAVPMPDTVEDWVRSMVVSIENQRVWGRHRGIRSWIAECRLNFAAASSRIPADDAELVAIATRSGNAVKSAIENLHRLSSTLP
jgi:hypothetical protein